MLTGTRKFYHQPSPEPEDHPLPPLEPLLPLEDPDDHLLPPLEPLVPFKEPDDHPLHPLDLLLFPLLEEPQPPWDDLPLLPLLDKPLLPQPEVQSSLSSSQPPQPHKLRSVATPRRRRGGV